ncbi:MAG TPA: pseudouridine synthase [Vicinamibacteria bacterium]|nr:pseudouridine synthase [Vicinamibacteria bacterium]
MDERLQKILSRAGVASRRAAESAIADGRVSVNGRTVRELGTKADAARDEIRLDGVRVRAPAERVYLLLNKPKGVVTTRQDPQGRPTVMELVPPVAGLFPVGRLDVNTEGLLLLTNDGAFAQKVAHPRYEVPRVYHAKVHRVPDAETLDRLRRGVRVDGEQLTVDRVRVLEAENNAWLEVTLHEGRHHEVRRLLEAVGHRVSKLRRVGLGPLTARGLKPGQFRSLTPAEVRGLSAPAGGRVRTPPSEAPAAPRPRPRRRGGARDQRRPRRERS